MKKTDVLIIGGGPAGAACAWRLKQNNVDCLVLDRCRFPRAKPCAGWVPPELFRDLKCSPAEYPYGITHFPSMDLSIRGVKLRIPTHQFAIRRIEFDQWLLDRSGATVEEHEARVIVPTGGGYLIDDVYFARCLVGAGGTYCPVYRCLFKENNPKEKTSLIVAQEDEFAYPAADPRCRLWFFEAGLPGYAWFVPKAGGYVNVGIGGNAETLKAHQDSLKRHWANLTAKLARMGLVQDHVYHPTAHVYYLRQKAPILRQGNAYLVGDAAGLATHDMGEGIRPAVLSGLLAAEAILHGNDYPLASIPKVSFVSILRLGWMWPQKE